VSSEDHSLEESVFLRKTNFLVTILGHYRGLESRLTGIEYTEEQTKADTDDIILLAGLSESGSDERVSQVKGLYSRRKDDIVFLLALKTAPEIYNEYICGDCPYRPDSGSSESPHDVSVKIVSSN